ncbi:MAG: glycoside hydrolase family 15 protein [Acidobacteria bacterium]|nr:glycoside hydrolase family 15 protein [Acidobacteriota bacterium]
MSATAIPKRTEVSDATAIRASAPSAFGGPGIEPRWTGSAKDGVGTAYSASSRAWYTLSLGVLNEVYYPTIDRPQIRDLQYLVTDGETFFHEEKQHLKSELEFLSHHALGFRITNTDPEGRYRIIKEVIGGPHQDAVLIRTRLEGDERFLSKLKLYALLAPHLEVGGWGNNGQVKQVAGREILTACKRGTWLALGATVPFLRRSCGYVGTSDGWTDLADNFQMDWEFDTAEDGNIALTGELDLSRAYEFTLGLAFGDSFHNAATTLLQSLDVPFDQQCQRFIEQWERACKRALPLEEVAGDNGDLYHVSHSLLLAHEDKRYQGAMIASLSIPWGDAKGDDDIGGYHLVWTRDMCNSAAGLLAAGNTETALRALVYLACSQQAEGGFHQNFWINGEPYWSGIQLDEVAFPIMLAWRLHVASALRNFDPYPMVLRAARYLIYQGPATPQERWEENSGYSPSTLASNIAALTCAALFARERGDEETARFVQEYADFLECHIEPWTVTTDGTLVPGINRHFIRIHPVAIGDPHPDEDPNHSLLPIRNRAPWWPVEFPAKEIVDAGFLELVRYGIRKPGDALIEDSLQVVDSVLKVETPFGPCWRRYNHDGYGQKADGGPYQGWGKGRAWPLLTGERGHYEFAAGRDVRSFIRAMEGFANASGLLPEQIWDEPDRPEVHMTFGRPTGAAMPLMWAHAEYIKLLRSVRDGQVFDLIPAVADRYLKRRDCRPLEVWKPSRQPRSVMTGATLRVQAPAPFRLHWTANEWQRIDDTRSTATALGIEFVDIPISPEQLAPIRFTFYWVEAERWEGQDFQVAVHDANAIQDRQAYFARLEEA